MYDFPWWVQGSVRRQSYIVIRRMSPNITLHLYPYFVHIHFPGFSITTTYTTGNYFPLKQKLLKMTSVLCSGDLNYKWETRDLKGLRVDSTCDNLFQTAMIYRIRFLIIINGAPHPILSKNPFSDGQDSSCFLLTRNSDPYTHSQSEFAQ